MITYSIQQVILGFSICLLLSGETLETTDVDLTNVLPLFGNAIKSLEKDFMKDWVYKDLFDVPERLGVTRELLDKSTANFGNEKRLRKVLVKALEGDTLDMVILGGSISRGAPFSERGGLDFRIYFHAIVEWWNHVFSTISDSKLVAKSVSIGGIGTDYYSYCLTPHLPEDTRPTIFLWELAANDRGRYDDKPFPRAQPLEQLTRNILLRPSKPVLLYANFFRGNDYIQSKCMNFEDEGGQKIAENYMITSISWRDLVCDNLNKGLEGFRMRDIFADDVLHPNIKGHAQMAYLLIYHLQSEFLRILRSHAVQTPSLPVFKEEVWSMGDMFIPSIIYHETSTKAPLCLTYFYNDNKTPNNTLEADIVNRDDFHYNVYKKFKLRGDQLGGLQTNFSEQLLTYILQTEQAECRLVLVTHTGTGSAQVWVDNHTPIAIETMNYHMGTKIEIVATNLIAGKHSLNILSLKGGFAISGIAII